jgi:hypothetical protein
MSSNQHTQRPIAGECAIFSAAGLTMLVLSSLAAHADVRYTTAMDMSASMKNSDTSGMGAPVMSTTTYVKGSSERKETSMHMGPMQMNTVTIQKCSTHEEYKLDPVLKIYTEDPIGGLNIGVPSKSPMSMMHPSRDTSSDGGGTGQVITTVNVQDLGSEVISNLKTHHAMLTTRIQTSGCSGNNDTTMRVETWTAPIQTFSCPEQYSPSREVDSPGGSGGGCKVTYVMHGDIEGMRSAYSGMIVQMKMYNGDKLMGVQTLSDYSQATLDESLFEIPSDYTKLSDEDYQKAESNAMMHNMLHGGGGGMGGGGGQDNGNTPTQDNGNGNQGTDNSGDNNTPPPPKKHSFGGIHLPF